MRPIYILCAVWLYVVLASITAVAMADECNCNNPPPEGSPDTLDYAIDSGGTPFDPDIDYHVLVYNPRGSQASLLDIPGCAGAMTRLGITLDPNRDIRDSTEGNDVTAADLASHRILIVGWNCGGDTGGLDKAILAAGITGRIILSGHDADFHTVNGPPAGKTFLAQAIQFILAGNGTGLITLGDTAAFSYLPSAWGVTAEVLDGQNIKSFSTEALASGVYENLDPNDMSNWGTSYHDRFTLQPASAFVTFEWGGTGTDKVTIARYNTFGMTLTKTDNLDPNYVPCVEPDDEFTYTIAWNRAGSSSGTFCGVSLVDYLPVGVTFVREIGSSGGVYNSATHTITWDLGCIAPAILGVMVA